MTQYKKRFGEKFDYEANKKFKKFHNLVSLREKWKVGFLNDVSYSYTILKDFAVVSAFLELANSERSIKLNYIISTHYKKVKIGWVYVEKIVILNH